MQWSSKIFSVLGSHINKMLIVPLIEYSLELKTTSVKQPSSFMLLFIFCAIVKEYTFHGLSLKS